MTEKRNDALIQNIGYPIRHTAPCWEQTRGSFGRSYWEMYSPKVKRNVKLFGDVGRDHWLLLEADPNVIWFCDSPVCFPGSSGEPGQNVLDMWVLFADGSEEYRTVRRTTAVSGFAKELARRDAWCERNGFVHRVVTERDLQPYRTLIDNCGTYIGFIPKEINARHVKVQRSVAEIVASTGPLPLADLLGRFVGVSEQLILSAVFTLIHSGTLYAPLDVQRYDRNIQLSLRTPS